jgi:hypothetical protein
MNSNVKPDLVVKYNLRESESTKQIVGSVAYQTSSAPLLSEREEVIGEWAIQTTVFNVTNPKNIALDKYPVNGSGVLYLPEGTIEYCSDIANLILEPTTKQYIYPSKNPLVFPIASGTGDFLNSSGFVVVIADNVSGKRDLLVYFNK